MYTKDIAGAFAKFLNTEVEGIVNICASEPISIKEYVLTLAKKIGKENLVKFQNEKTNQPPIIVGDNTRLLNEVGYTLKYSLEKAVEDLMK